MGKETFEEYIDEYINFYKTMRLNGYDIESLRKLMVRNLQNIKRKYLKSRWESNTTISRTIYFKPLSWEEIQKQVDEIKNTKEEIRIIPIQQFNGGALNIFGIYLCKAEEEFSIEITDNEDSPGVVNRFDFSEEGYEQAIDWARELFLKEWESGDNEK